MHPSQNSLKYLRIPSCNGYMFNPIDNIVLYRLKVLHPLGIYIQSRDIVLHAPLKV